MVSRRLTIPRRGSYGRLARDPAVLIALLAVAAALAIFTLYPLVEAARLSLFPRGSFSLEVYRQILQARAPRQALANSILLGMVVACSGTLIGFLFAFAIHRADIPGKQIFKVLTLLPFISPPFMLALSVILLLGRNGLISFHLLGLEDFNIYGLRGLVLVQTMGLFPIAYLVLSGVLQSINPDLENASANLGASRWETFWRVTLPLATPGIAGAWLLIFVESLADFGNPMVLAGRFEVLSVQAYLQFTGMGDLPRGAGLAILLLIPSLSAFLLQRYWVSRKSYVTVTGKAFPRRAVKTPLLLKALMLLSLTAVSATVLIFYGTVIAGSFVRLWGVDFSLTLEHVAYVWDVGFETLKNTVILAAWATPVTGLLGMVIAFLVVRKRFPGKRALEVTSMLTFAVPGTVVGIGYILAFNRWPILLVGTPAIIVLCFIFRNMPVGIEAGVAALRQISPEIEDASANLGGSTLYTFRKITLPLIEPAFFAGLAYSFVRAMTAVSAVIFLVSARWNHLTVLILAQTEILRLGAASVLCLVLIVVVMGSLAVIRGFVGSGRVQAFQ